jgi:hypothetical protein
MRDKFRPMLSSNILSMAALKLQNSLCATDCVLLIMRMVVFVGACRLDSLCGCTLRYATLHNFGS